MATPFKEFEINKNKKDDDLITRKADEIEIALDTALGNGIDRCRMKRPDLDHEILEKIRNEVEKRYKAKNVGWNVVSFTAIGDNKISIVVR